MLVNIRLLPKVYAYSFVHISWWFLSAAEGEDRRYKDKSSKWPGFGTEKNTQLTLLPK